MTYPQLHRIAEVAAQNNLDTLSALVAEQELTGGWLPHGRRFRDFLADGIPRFTIFTEGNDKLPFFTFSSLPKYTCPGMGSCGDWCYSFKAWRFPASFFRQLQNTMLIRRKAPELTKAFLALPRDVPFRLYNDGDFESLETLRFWFDLLEKRPDISAYGYSKSWDIFLEYADSGGRFPDNYRLNLSTGGRFDRETAMEERMLRLPCTRGRFITVPTPSKADYDDKSRWLAHATEVRRVAVAAGHSKVFVCPGSCGPCTPRGHACGLPNWQGITIAIGTH